MDRIVDESWCGKSYDRKADGAEELISARKTRRLVVKTMHTNFACSHEWRLKGCSMICYSSFFSY